MRKFLMPAFSEMLLRDMTTRTLQTHFSGLGNSTISGDVVLKIKEVLSSVLKSAGCWLSRSRG